MQKVMVDFDKSVLMVMANGLMEERTVCPICGNPKDINHWTCLGCREYSWLAKQKTLNLKIMLLPVVFKKVCNKVKQLFENPVYHNSSYRAIVDYLVKCLPEVKTINGIPLAALEGAVRKVRHEVFGSAEIEVGSTKQKPGKPKGKDEQAKIIALPTKTKPAIKPTKVSTANRAKIQFILSAAKAAPIITVNVRMVICVLKKYVATVFNKTAPSSDDFFLFAKNSGSIPLFWLVSNMDQEKIPANFENKLRRYTLPNIHVVWDCLSSEKCKLETEYEDLGAMVRHKVTKRMLCNSGEYKKRVAVLKYACDFLCLFFEQVKRA